MRPVAPRQMLQRGRLRLCIPSLLKAKFYPTLQTVGIFFGAYMYILHAIPFYD